MPLGRAPAWKLLNAMAAKGELVVADSLSDRVREVYGWSMALS